MYLRRNRPSAYRSRRSQHPGILLIDDDLTRAKVIKQKTGQPVQFEITGSTRQAVEAWIVTAHLNAGNFLFPSRVHEPLHFGTRQYARIVDSWVEEIFLATSMYGRHSMRREKALLIYRRTKKLRAIQLLLGHSKPRAWVRHLGIEVEDALELAEQTDA